MRSNRNNFNSNRDITRINQNISNLERKEAIHKLSGHKIRAWYYSVLLKWYKRYE